MKKTPLLLLLTLPFFGQSQEWDVLASGGKTVSQNGSSMCYTVGQAVVLTATGTTHTALQGFQQPNFGTVGIEETSSYSTLQFDVFPNPTVDKVRLVNSPFAADAPFWLFDSQGRLVRTMVINENQSFDLHQLPAGNYHLTTVDENTKTIYNAPIILTK